MSEDAHTPPTLREISSQSSTTEATWQGGPLDGVAMNVIVGERFFPLYGAAALSGPNSVPASPGRRTARPRRLCPVLHGPDGRLVIDWHAGTVHA
jgi:hypothetical protein